MASVNTPVAVPADGRVVLYNVDWETYDRLRNDLGENPVRLTYDGNALEIMSPSRQHEHAKMVLASLITLLTVELKIPVSNGGSMTFRRADLNRGLEPDVCYWIAHESDVRGRNEIDLTIDPPPDLAIEIDISPSRLDRPGIYAALRVPEVWRYDGEGLHVELLRPDGTYCPSETSAGFPFLPVRELARFLAMSEIEGDSHCQIAFVNWLREQNFEV